MDMNRRGFLKLASSLGVAAAVPIHIINEVEAAVEAVDVVEAVAPSSHGLYVFDGKEWIKAGDIVSIAHSVETDIVPYFDDYTGIVEPVSGVRENKFQIETTLSADERFYEFIKNETSMKMKANFSGFEIVFFAIMQRFGIEYSCTDIPVVSMDITSSGGAEIVQAE